MTTDYQYKTLPYPHQDREFIRSRDFKTWAFFFSQRTGKSKASIDTAAYSYERGKIDGMVIVAPPGVHEQWVKDEIPDHMPDRIPWNALIWRTGKAPKTFAKQLTQLCMIQGLAIFAINRQAVITPAGRAALKKFLTARQCLFIWDESADIRTPSAKTTRAAIALGKLAPMRRILAGVPCPEGPMDYYSQFRFLHKDILGCRNFQQFKLQYGEWEARERGSIRRIPDAQAYDEYGRLRKGLFLLPKKDARGRPIQKNLDRLNDLIGRRVSRVTIEEAFPHLPAKQYQKFYVDMSPEQHQIYNQLAEEYQATLVGRTISVPLLLTRFVRLQQVVCGYLPMPLEVEVPADFDWFGDAEAPAPKYEIVRIPGANRRVEVLDEILDKRAGDPVIIWARYKPDINLLMDHFASNGTHAARYDGTVPPEDRADVKARFGRGEIEVLVGNQMAGGTGLTLKPAQTVIYYSNYFGLLPRLQSEDRPIHGGLTRPVLYADLVASGTIEEKLITTLQLKHDLFKEIMGDRDRIASWFQKAA